MENFAIYGTMRAKEGKEQEVENFLKGLLTFAEGETGTKRWFALRGKDGMFGIFDTFDDQASRLCHLNGRIARALSEKAADLFEGDLQLVTVDVVAEK